MPKNSTATAHSSAKVTASAPGSAAVDQSAEDRRLGSNLEKVDAHRITFEEYLEIPELNESWLGPIEVDDAGQETRRGRPRKPDRKQHVSLRLSPDVLDYYRAKGPGWQAHVENVLRAAMSLEQDAAERGEPWSLSGT